MQFLQWYLQYLCQWKIPCGGLQGHCCFITAEMSVVLGWLSVLGVKTIVYV